MTGGQSKDRATPIAFTLGSLHMRLMIVEKDASSAVGLKCYLTSSPVIVLFK